MDVNASPASFSADLSGCAALPVLTGDEEVADLFIAALDRAGATMVEAVSHAFPKTGLTLRADPARVARGPAHLAGNRHDQH